MYSATVLLRYVNTACVGGVHRIIKNLTAIWKFEAPEGWHETNSILRIQIGLDAKKKGRVGARESCAPKISYLETYQQYGPNFHQMPLPEQQRL